LPHRLGQLHARGFSTTSADPSDCWAIAEGASIYPRIVFDSGIRYAEELQFGQVYQELGSRLHWRGFRIRFLPHTYVINHDNGHSITDAGVHLAGGVFANALSFLHLQADPGPQDALRA